MASVVIVSKIFADLFGQAAMRELVGDAGTLQARLDIEAALVRAQAGLGAGI